MRQGDTISIEPHQDNVATAQCKKGEIVTGGGFYENDLSGKLIVARNVGNDAGGWIAAAINTGDNAELLHAEVMCMKVGP